MQFIQETTTETQRQLESLPAPGDIKQIRVGPGKPVYAPPCSYTECQDHFYLEREQAAHHWYCHTRKLRDVEAKALLVAKVKDIHTGRAYIKHAVELHGDAILKA